MGAPTPESLRAHTHVMEVVWRGVPYNRTLPGGGLMGLLLLQDGIRHKSTSTALTKKRRWVEWENRDEKLWQQQALVVPCLIPVHSLIPAEAAEAEVTTAKDEFRSSVLYFCWRLIPDHGRPN